MGYAAAAWRAAGAAGKQSPTSLRISQLFFGVNAGVNVSVAALWRQPPAVSPLTPRESCRRRRGGSRSAAANCPSRPPSTRFPALCTRCAAPRSSSASATLSVCAFHRQLGGTPQPAEFAPSRQYNGSAKGSSRYFASELPGYYDEYDEYVYEWARSRFVRDVQNLTGWRCAMERWEDGDRLACAE